MSETCDYIIDVCQEHSDDARDEGCPYCEIERLTAEYSNLQELARRVIAIVDRDQVDIQALKAAVSGRHERIDNVIGDLNVSYGPADGRESS